VGSTKPRRTKEAAWGKLTQARKNSRGPEKSWESFCSKSLIIRLRKATNGLGGSGWEFVTFGWVGVSNKTGGEDGSGGGCDKHTDGAGGGKVGPKTGITRESGNQRGPE